MTVEVVEPKGDVLLFSEYGGDLLKARVRGPLIDLQGGVMVTAMGQKAVVWDLRNDRHTTFDGHTSAIVSLFFFAEDLVISLSREETLLWHWKTGSIIGRLEVSTCGDISDLSLALAVEGGSVVIYELSNFELRRKLEVSLGDRIDVVKWWKGEYLVCAIGSDVVVWDVAKNQLKSRIDNVIATPPISVIHASDMDECAFVNEDGRLSVWNLENAQPLGEHRVLGDSVVDMKKGFAKWLLVQSEFVPDVFKLLLSDSSWQKVDWADGSYTEQIPRNLDALYVLCKERDT